MALHVGAVVTLSYHGDTYEGTVTRVSDDGRACKVEFMDNQQQRRIVWRLRGEIKVVVR